MKIYDICKLDEESLLKNIQEENKSIFDIAIKFLKLGYELFPFDGKVLKNNLNPNIQTLLLGFYAQIFRLFRSIIILCKCGLDTEALLPLRSILETTSYLYYIAEKDQEKRFKHYVYSRALSDCNFVSEIIKIFPEVNCECNAIMERFEEAIKYFKDEYGQDITIKEIKEKYALNPQRAAESLQKLSEYKMFFDKQYKTIYRFASSVCHGDEQSQYIRPLINTNEFLLRVGPTSTSTKDFLIYAFVFFLFAMLKINEFLKIGKDREIEDIQKELDKFAKI